MKACWTDSVAYSVASSARPYLFPVLRLDPLIVLVDLADIWLEGLTLVFVVFVFSTLEYVSLVPFAFLHSFSVPSSLLT